MWCSITTTAIDVSPDNDVIYNEYGNDPPNITTFAANTRDTANDAASHIILILYYCECDITLVDRHGGSCTDILSRFNTTSWGSIIIIIIITAAGLSVNTLPVYDHFCYLRNRPTAPPQQE